jgi:hypothetical protein
VSYEVDTNKECKEEKLYEENVDLEERKEQINIRRNIRRKYREEEYIYFTSDTSCHI